MGLGLWFPLDKPRLTQSLSQFPYDNICDPVNATTGVSGLYEYQFPNGTVEQMRIFQDTEVVFCQQSWIEYDGFPFPPTPRLQPEGLRWMTDSQETLTTIYGWTSVAVVVVFIVAFFGIAISRFLISWFRGVHEPEGQNQNIDYSSNVEIDAYVPMIKKGGFQFPFLACDIDNVDRVRLLPLVRGACSVHNLTHPASGTHWLDGSLSFLRLPQFDFRYSLGRHATNEEGGRKPQ